MTVVAPLDWITAVTAMPSSSPRMGLAVILDKIPCNLLPAVCSRALPIRSIPYRNMAMPPIRVNTLKMLIPGYTSILSYFVFLNRGPRPHHALCGIIPMLIIAKRAQNAIP